MSKELDVTTKPAGDDQILKLALPWTISDDLKPEVRMRTNERGSRRNQRFMFLLRPEIRDGHDLRDVRRGRSVGVGREVDSVGDHGNRPGCEPLLTKDPFRRR